MDVKSGHVLRCSDFVLNVDLQRKGMATLGVLVSSSVRRRGILKARVKIGHLPNMLGLIPACLHCGIRLIIACSVVHYFCS